jgi:hypothetical protein
MKCYDCDRRLSKKVIDSYIKEYPFKRCDPCAIKAVMKAENEQVNKTPQSKDRHENERLES